MAAQGPLWAPGGDRGLYKTTDGGKTWTQSLKISENTGVTDVVLDPRNPDVLLRRRLPAPPARVDADRRRARSRRSTSPPTAARPGRSSRSGLPKGDLGRIGLAVSPVEPGRRVRDHRGHGQEPAASTARPTAAPPGSGAATTCAGGAAVLPGAVRRPEARTASTRWTCSCRSPRTAARPSASVGRDRQARGQPRAVDRPRRHRPPAERQRRRPLRELRPRRDLALQGQPAAHAVLPGGGRQRQALLQRLRRHAGQQHAGRPVAHAERDAGIANADWFVTLGGDGFQTRGRSRRIPNIVYAESPARRAGPLRPPHRRARSTSSRRPGPGDDPLRWNWDSPLIISPHAHTRLYFAAQRLFRSDDRGDTWKPVSPDLTRQHRPQQAAGDGPRLGRGRGGQEQLDLVLRQHRRARRVAAKQEGLLYVGTDDGLIQVSEDGGGSWRKVEHVPGRARRTYVSDLDASRHDAGDACTPPSTTTRWATSSRTC